MIKKLYYKLHNLFSRPEERGQYSAGCWQDMVRCQVLKLCRGTNGNIIEVGCGEGLFLSKLAQTKPEARIWGIDVWDKILEQAKNNLARANVKNVELLRADAINIPFADAFFDCVVCINVFYNLPSEKNVEQVFAQISRISKPGARFIFDIRNSYNLLLWVKYKLAKYYDETVKDLPLRAYRLAAIKKILKINGFEFKRRISIGFPKGWFSPIFVIEAMKK